MNIIKLLLVIAVFHFNFVSIYSNELILKKEVFLNRDTIFLSDLITVPLSNSDIIITDNSAFPLRVTNGQLIDLLLENGLRGFTVSGTQCLIYRIEEKNPVSTDNNYNNNLIKKNSKLEELISMQLSKYINNRSIELSVAIVGNTDLIDLNYNNGDLIEIKKIENGLKDIGNLDKVKLIRGNDRIDLKINITLMGNILVAKKMVRKNGLIENEDFTKKMVDITGLTEIDSIVITEDFITDKILRFVSVKKIKSGEILRWTNIKKLPIIDKGTVITAIFNRNGIEIVQDATVIEPLFEGNRITIGLKSKAVVEGTFMNGENGNYVKID